AEDGIRDRNVTGVQTCALPIYFLGVWEVGDVLGVIAWPSNIFLTWLQRCANRVQCVHEITVWTDLVQCFLAHARHDAHGQNNICGVSQLNTELWLWIINRTHAERNDVHGASAHRAAELLRHFFLHRCWRYPVI